MDLPTTSDSLTVSRARTDSGEFAADVPQDDKKEQRYKTHRRFDRAARLFSEAGLHQLMGSRVMIVGVGGVGSFTAESLARSGVGRLDLVDFDKVCITNSNRQLHAMQGTIGRRKVEVMAERLRLIHPTSQVEPVAEFYSVENGGRLLDSSIDFVVDAIDNLSAKAHLVATCVQKNIPVVSSMGAAARMDPTQVQVADLGATYKDPFAAALRKILRKEYGFAVDQAHPIGVDAVFSPEEAVLPSPPAYDEGEGFRCVCPGGKNGLHDCDRRARIDGTASFVTGTFGMVAASVVVRRLIDVPFRAAPRQNSDR